MNCRQSLGIAGARDDSLYYMYSRRGSILFTVSIDDIYNYIILLSYLILWEFCRSYCEKKPYGNSVLFVQMKVIVFFRRLMHNLASFSSSLGV